MTVIRTPDHRLRVFISAVPDELEHEVAAVRRAVRRLRMTAVLFETPPGLPPARDVYRAYVAQSHVFVGIYAEAYGPAVEDSGQSQQDEEYRVAAQLPRLLYVRGPSPARDPRLSALLARIAADQPRSSRGFRDADELEQLVVDDLAVLLTERYETARMAAAVPTPRRPAAADPVRPVPALPAPATALIGRSAERATLGEMVRTPEVRLVTLTGPGGIGKTRLALAVATDVAAHFPDGVRWADTSMLRDPMLVAAALVHALELPEAADRPPFHTLVEALHDRCALLVVDGFERVAAAGRTLADLLGACPRLTILVTSRALLRVRGEHDFPVPPLPARAPDGGLPDAVRLFGDRARAVDPSFAVTDDNVSDITHICERLDGLPLAIELAAARIRLLTPTALLSRLDHRLRVLTGGPRDLPERQRALQAALDWDYELLDEHERAVFRRLAVCANGTTLESVEAIVVDPAQAPYDVLAVVGSLVDKSLVRQADDRGPFVRLAMLETVREYAQARLAEAGEQAAVRHRHAARYLDVAAACTERLHGAQQVATLDRLEADHDNLRAAVRWAAESGDIETELRLCGALSAFWQVHGHLREGAVLLESALSRSVGWRTAERAEVLADASVHARARHDFVPARAWLDEALDIYAELDDRRGIARTLRLLGTLSYEQDDLEHARMQWQHSRDAYAEIGDERGIAIVANNLALLARFDGELDTALRLYLQCVGTAARIGDQEVQALAVTNLAYVARDLGAPGVALGLTRRSARKLLELGRPWHLSDCLEIAAASIAATGEVDTAIRLYAAAAALREALGAARAESEQAEYDTQIAEVRSAAGPDRFAAQWNDGERLSHVEAVRLVDDVAGRLAVADEAIDGWLAARAATDREQQPVG